MHSELINYRSILEANRETFLLNHKEEFFAFEHIDRCLQNIWNIVGTKRTDQGESIISLAAFLLIIVRQGRNAFECLSRYQSSEAWLIFRPAIEASLIIGKFLDDPANSSLWKKKKQLWENRKTNKEDFEKYRREFEKDGLIPKSLPMGEAFRHLLSKINDEFVHMNYEYFLRDIKVKETSSSDIQIEVHFVDHDPQDQKAQLFSFLHMYYLLVSSLGKAFSPKYSQEKAMNINIDTMEKNWGPKIKQLVQASSNLKEFCQIFGLWNL
jgi:hypothetical protein